VGAVHDPEQLGGQYERAVSNVVGDIVHISANSCLSSC
jgi:hypothetical protein